MWEAWVWDLSQPVEISQFSHTRKMFRPADKKELRGGKHFSLENKIHGARQEWAKADWAGAGLEHQVLCC